MKNSNGRSDNQNVASSQLRQIVYWLSVIGAIFIVGTSLLFSVYQIWTTADMRRDVVIAHFAAVIGLPCAAIAAILVVIVLEGTSGPIKVEGFGVKFEGASGPIVFWILCFLSIAGSIKLCW